MAKYLKGEKSHGFNIEYFFWRHSPVMPRITVRILRAYSLEGLLGLDNNLIHPGALTALKPALAAFNAVLKSLGE